MKTVKQIATLIALVLITQCTFAQEKICKLKGTVVGRDSKELVLVKVTDDVRFSQTIIPIVENKFEYDLKISQLEAYELVFNDELNRGAWRPIQFMPDSSVVEFILQNTNDFEKNKVIGGPLNRAKNAYESRKWEIMNLSLSLSKIQDSLQKANNTAENLKITNKLDSLENVLYAHHFNYIKTAQNIYSYSLLYRSVRYSSTPKNEIINMYYGIYSKKFPDHPYTKIVGNMLNGYTKLQVGGQYIDFSAPTIDGKMVTLSNEIKGKIALIDLWASWCGPCRSTSKSMIPVYEKYKNKGFTIVGVACEYKNSEAFKTALEKDKYPWLNLIELDNKNGIWDKYKVSGGPGSTWLVDQNGKILAIHPTATEAEKILSELLK